LEQLEVLEHLVLVVPRAALGLLVNLVQMVVQAQADLLDRQEIRVVREIQESLE